MFYLRLASVQQKNSVSQLSSLRHLGYCPSSWGSFTSASLSRYSHCTLKEISHREQDELNAAIPPPTSNTSTTVTSAVKGPVRQLNVDARSVTAATHNNQQDGLFTSPPTVQFAKGKSPRALRYSLELSLPHLPNRSPFIGAESGGNLLATLISSVNGNAVENASNSGRKSTSLHPRWSEFVSLCEAVTKADAASHDSTPSPTSAPHLTSVTIPCKEPYFCGEDETGRPTYPLSTIQAVVLLFHRRWRIPVTLALNTTVPNRADAQLQATGATVVGASSAGIQAIVRDFVQRMGGRQVLLVRGDTPFIQQSTNAPATTATELRTSSDLVRCVRDVLKTSDLASSESTVEAVQIAVAGYPQGHPLDRKWGTSPITTSAAGTTVATIGTATSVVTATVPGVSPETNARNSFIDKFERNFNAADSFFERVVDSRVQGVPLLALHHLFRTLGRLHAVRQLWLTPSTYPIEARMASMRQLIEEKILMTASPQKGDGDTNKEGASVIVTQMLTSAQEFTQFTNEVQHALHTYASTSLSSRPVSVKVIPGILLPHPTDANVFLRSLYYAKVIPNTQLQRALETYRTDLKSVWRSIVTHNNTDEEGKLECGSAAASTVSYQQDVADGYMTTWPGMVTLQDEEHVAATEAFVKDAHRRAAARFAAAWMAETIDLVSTVHERSGGEQTPVHFFTMFNDKVDVRLAQLLEAYAARQLKQQQ